MVHLFAVYLVEHLTVAINSLYFFNFFQVAASKDTGYEFIEQLLDNVSTCSFC